MARVITPEQFQAEIQKILDEYSDEVSRKSEECVRKVANKGAKRLRSSSPSRSGGYASGWSVKTEKGRMDAVSIIHNKKKPGLPHLLEYGHVTRNGTGRTLGRTPAHEHIAPVETQIIEEFQRTLKGDLSR